MNNSNSKLQTPKSVAVLHYAAPPGIGGVEVTMLHHARVLANQGNAVRLVAGSGGIEQPGVSNTIDPLFGSRGDALDAVTRSLAQGQTGAAFDSLVDQIAPRLAEALAGADVLIAHNVLSLHKNLALTAALHRLHTAGRAPTILAWCHDFAWRDPLYQPELHPGHPWNLLRHPWPGVRYVVVSADRQSILAELLGLPSSEITVVTPGVDLAGMLKLEVDTVALVERHQLLQANPLLLLPARITRRKNIELGIAIVGALRAEGLAPRLVVTGPPGPHNPTNAAYLAQLEAQIAASGADDAVLFLYRAYTSGDRPKPVSDALLADLYRLADGLLFPSRSEGFGIPMVEAGLIGLPIFCSDIPPFHEIAGDAAHYFDPQSDPRTIAHMIAGFYRGSAAHHLRRRTRLHATWDAIYHQSIAPLLASSP
ncbi:MAG: glycosyltransferase [Chloroflexales bacterium]|nr:glycosyltransferase [Chloroflexales bacterium]